MANSREDQILGSSERSLALSKFLSSLLAEEGLMLAVLVFALPTELSISWGVGFGLVGIALLMWEYGYQEKLPDIVGPYRIVRNPHSLALWLVSFGLAIAARSFPAVILSLILLPWLFYIDHEENAGRPDLKRLRYRYRVPALIPTLIPYEASPNKGFSWRRAVKIRRWPSRPRLVSALVTWVYLIVSFNLNLPYWAGLIAFFAFVGIKLALGKGKYLPFAFRKKPLLFGKPL